MPADLSVSLPWQGLSAGGAAMSQAFSGNPAQTLGALGPAYNQNYQAALGLNAGLYSQTQTGYQNLRTQLDKQYSDINAGYAKDYGDVLGRIAGSNKTNLQDINSAYDSFAGQQLQGAIDRGLGNSTVQQNMQRGVQMDRERALTASNNQFAQLGAGYASSITGQQLQSQQQGAQLGANLGLDQLRFAGSATAPYPNAGLYSQLAQQAGANQQGQQDRDRANQLMGRGGFAQAGGGVAGGISGGASGFGPVLPPAGFGMQTGGYNGTTPAYFGGFGGYGRPYQPSAGLGFSGGGYDSFAGDTGGVDSPPDYDSLYSEGTSTLGSNFGDYYG